MEPIPSILAWPGGGAPVQGVGATATATGEAQATGFANKLDGLAALLDSADKKGAAPDGQTAPAQQLDLLAAMVAQYLPQQPQVFPTAPVALPETTSVAPGAAPVAKAATVSTPSAAVTRAVVHDISQVIEPDAFASMRFKLPAPSASAPVVDAAPVKIDPSSADTKSVYFGQALTTTPVTTVPVADSTQDDSQVKVETADTAPMSRSAVFFGTPKVDGPLVGPVAQPVISSQATPVSKNAQAAQPVKDTTGTTPAPAPVPVPESKNPAVAAVALPQTTSAPAAEAVPIIADGEKPAPRPKGPRTEMSAGAKPLSRSDQPITGEAPGIADPSAPVQNVGAKDATPVAENQIQSKAPLPATDNVAAQPKPVAQNTEKQEVVAKADDATAMIDKASAKPAKRDVTTPAPDLFKELTDKDEAKTDKAPTPKTEAHAPVDLGVKDVKIDAKDKVEVVRNVREAVSDTVRDLVEARRPGKMTLRLMPEDLGTVTVTVKTLGPRVDAEVTASDPSLRASLAHHRNDLVASMERRGLQMGDFNVGQEQAAWDASQQAGHRQQQGHPMRKEFEQAGRLASSAPSPTMAVAAFAASSSDSVDYMV